ncbi:unnamed protein product [Psylliodes chrysocephalus]|uniref:Uncharacterized protein n=1 Tax=Psylliodes chrysocephalus TaxID=3402493 RepID=A0A9P0GF71_9CUCU|nr:unnamed protein product [Psylliodes chrysocephala]
MVCPKPKFMDHFSSNYKDMLEVFFYPQLKEEILNTVYFQQEGAPPHYLSSNEFFELNLWRQCIGRAVPSNGLPIIRIRLAFFFIWGYIKEICYDPTPTNTELSNNIIHVF